MAHKKGSSLEFFSLRTAEESSKQQSNMNERERRRMKREADKEMRKLFKA